MRKGGMDSAIPKGLGTAPKQAHPRASRRLGARPQGSPTRDPNRRSRDNPDRAAEPKTPAGRARKKILMGLNGGFGCVLAYAEMLTVVEALREGWLREPPE